MHHNNIFDKKHGCHPCQEHAHPEPQVEFDCPDYPQPPHHEHFPPPPPCHSDHAELLASILRKQSALQADLYLIQSFLKNLSLSDLVDVNSCLNPAELQVLSYNGLIWDSADPSETQIQITPNLTEGNLVATVTLNGDDIELYSKGSDVSVNATYTEEEGVKIATITVDGQPTDIYSPQGGSNVVVTPEPKEGASVTRAATITVNGVDKIIWDSDTITQVIPTFSADENVFTKIADIKVNQVNQSPLYIPKVTYTSTVPPASHRLLEDRLYVGTLTVGTDTYQVEIPSYVSAFNNNAGYITGDSLQLSKNYTPSVLENSQLRLAPLDTFEEAFGKLDKAIIDNERTIAASLNDLNDRKLDKYDLPAQAQADWLEEDESSPAFIQNKPDNLGSFDNIKINEIDGVITEINHENISVLTLTGADIKVTGYTESQATNEDLTILPTDTINQALGKLQKVWKDDEAAITRAFFAIAAATGFNENLEYVKEQTGTLLENADSLQDADAILMNNLSQLQTDFSTIKNNQVRFSGGTSGLVKFNEIPSGGYNIEIPYEGNCTNITYRFPVATVTSGAEQYWTHALILQYLETQLLPPLIYTGRCITFEVSDKNWEWWQYVGPMSDGIISHSDWLLSTNWKQLNISYVA